MLTPISQMIKYIYDLLARRKKLLPDSYYAQELTADEFDMSKRLQDAVFIKKYYPSKEFQDQVKLAEEIYLFWVISVMQ